MANEPTITDAARKLAEEHGLDLAAVTPTGADGIILDDVRRAVEAQAEAQRLQPAADETADAVAQAVATDAHRRDEPGHHNPPEDGDAPRSTVGEGDLLPPAAEDTGLVVYTFDHAGSTVGKSGRGYSYGVGSVVEAVDGELDHVPGVRKVEGPALPKGPALPGK